MKTTIFSALTFLALTCSAYAGEKLDYQLKVMGTEYGTASLYYNGSKAYGDIKSNEKWSSVFNVNNRMASQISKAGYPSRTEYDYEFSDSKGFYNIDYGTSRVRIAKNRNGKKRNRTFVPKRRLHDMITWVGAIREAAEKKPGKKIVSYVFSGARVYKVVCRPHKTVNLQTQIGTKRSIPYTVIITRPGNYKRELKVWFNAEGRFEPLRLVGKFAAGHAEASIISIKRELKHN